MTNRKKRILFASTVSAILLLAIAVLAVSSMRLAAIDAKAEGETEITPGTLAAGYTLDNSIFTPITAETESITVGVYAGRYGKQTDIPFSPSGSQAVYTYANTFQAACAIGNYATGEFVTNVSVNDAGRAATVQYSNAGYYFAAFESSSPWWSYVDYYDGETHIYREKFLGTICIKKPLKSGIAPDTVNVQLIRADDNAIMNADFSATFGDAVQTSGGYIQNYRVNLTYPAAPAITASIDKATCLPGDTATITAVTDTGAPVSISVVDFKGSESVLTENTYTFEKAGNYKFIFTAENAETVEKTVYVQSPTTLTYVNTAFEIAADYETLPYSDPTHNKPNTINVPIYRDVYEKAYIAYLAFTRKTVTAPSGTQTTYYAYPADELGAAVLEACRLRGKGDNAFSKVPLMGLPLRHNLESRTIDGTEYYTFTNAETVPAEIPGQSEAVNVSKYYAIVDTVYGETTTTVTIADGDTTVSALTVPAGFRVRVPGVHKTEYENVVKEYTATPTTWGETIAFNTALDPIDGGGSLTLQLGEQVKKVYYTVRFIYGGYVESNGELIQIGNGKIETRRTLENTSPIAPSAETVQTFYNANPGMAGYDFKGWKWWNGSAWVMGVEAAAGDRDYFSSDIEIKYTITLSYLTADGDRKTQAIQYRRGTVPDRLDDYPINEKLYYFYFDGWDKTPAAVSKDITYTATYRYYKSVTFRLPLYGFGETVKNITYDFTQHLTTSFTTPPETVTAPPLPNFAYWQSEIIDNTVLVQVRTRDGVIMPEIRLSVDGAETTVTAQYNFETFRYTYVLDLKHNESVDFSVFRNYRVESNGSITEDSTRYLIDLTAEDGTPIVEPYITVTSSNKVGDAFAGAGSSISNWWNGSVVTWWNAHAGDWWKEMKDSWKLATSKVGAFLFGTTDDPDSGIFGSLAALFRGSSGLSLLWIIIIIALGVVVLWAVKNFILGGNKQ